MCVRGCVCESVCERDIESEREGVFEMREIESKRERMCLFVCMCVCVCVCVCVIICVFCSAVVCSAVPYSSSERSRDRYSKSIPTPRSEVEWAEQSGGCMEDPRTLITELTGAAAPLRNQNPHNPPLLEHIYTSVRTPQHTRTHTRADCYSLHTQPLWLTLAKVIRVLQAL